MRGEDFGDGGNNLRQDAYSVDGSSSFVVNRVCGTWTGNVCPQIETGRTSSRRRLHGCLTYVIEKGVNGVEVTGPTGGTARDSREGDHPSSRARAEGRADSEVGGSGQHRAAGWVNRPGDSGDLVV